MVKARVRTAETAGPMLVQRYIAGLVVAGDNARRFDAVFDEMQADLRLTVGDVVAIAAGYCRGGSRPRSKTLALASISKRFVEIVRERRRATSGQAS